MVRVNAIFPELKGPRKEVHLVGIGGIGISALARWFMAQRGPSASSGRANKWLISGSDLVKSSITQGLAKDGAEVKIGHKKWHINRRLGLVIHSKAAKLDNPELREAKRLGIPTLAYSEAVGRLTRHYKTIAIAGAHGKSTTTALASLILKKAGLDPTVIIGTNMREFGGKNFRDGRGEWLILEADEFGKSFLDYSPAVAVITNIDLEHLDTYKNLADIKNNFFKFLANTRRGGIFVLNKDSKNLRSLSPRINKLARKNKYRVLWYSLGGNTAKKIRPALKIPGEHNVSNALAAYKIGRALGISHKKILSAIGSYRGSWRRFEYRGKFSIFNFQFSIFDDYAHHPTEIRATLRALKEKYPHSPVVCVYQPHQGKRLRVLFKDFQTSFGDADILVLVPMYQVAGRDKINPRFTSKTLAAAIKLRYPNRAVFYLSDPKNIKGFLTKILSATRYPLPAILVMMGAGNIVNYTPILLKK